MSKIKICGIRRMEDVDIVNEALPDYIGLILAPSKRQVSIEKAAELCEALNPRIKKVGVFVDQEKQFIEQAQKNCGLDVIQLHGSESSSFCKSFEGRVWKAISISSKEDLSKDKEYQVEGILLDTYHKGMAGGTGLRFDWEILKQHSFEKPWVLAGGIALECIEEALGLKPDIIDVSSGVESDGVKDRHKVVEIVKKVREYNEKNGF